MADGTLTTRMEEKRAAILEAALDLFAERGFDGTAVPAVAAAAGVGAGTIYRYFEGKEALVNAVFQEHKSRLVTALLSGFPFDQPPRDQFRAFFERATAFLRAHPRAYRFLELHHHAPYLDEKSRAIEAQIDAIAHKFFEETARQRITKPLPPELLAAMVWGAVVYLVKAELTGHLTLTEPLLEAAEQSLWEAIRT